MSERTLVLVKPDGVQRGLVGEVVSRIERKGLRLAALELKTSTEDLAEQHYAEHGERPFFGELVEFITCGPVAALVVEGPRAIEAFRQLAGGTDPVEKAAPGSIRGDFALETGSNIVHGSDSPESAEREIKLSVRLKPSGKGPAGDRYPGSWSRPCTTASSRCWPRSRSRSSTSAVNSTPRSSPGTPSPSTGR